MREGHGVMYYPDGSRREGSWREDKLRGEVREGGGEEDVRWLC